MAGKTKAGHRWTRPTLIPQASGPEGLQARKGMRQHASGPSDAEHSAYGRYGVVPAMNRLRVQSRQKLRCGRITCPGTCIRRPH